MFSNTYTQFITYYQMPMQKFHLAKTMWKQQQRQELKIIEYQYFKFLNKSYFLLVTLNKIIFSSFVFRKWILSSGILEDKMLSTGIRSNGIMSY